MVVPKSILERTRTNIQRESPRLLRQVVKRYVGKRAQPNQTTGKITMTFPTSTVPEIQKRINRASEIFATLDEETIFWLKWQHACTLAAKERLNNGSFSDKSGSLQGEEK